MSATVSAVGDLIHPRGSVERITVVLEAYLDASEEQPRIPVAAMGGWVANQAHWQRFENLWKPFLARNEIKGRFRTSEFLARQGQFNWSDEKHNRVKQDIADIFNEIGMVGFGVAIDCNSFKEWRLKQNVFVHPDPYYICLQRHLWSLILNIHEVPKDEGVAIYIDRDNARQKIGESVAQWYEEQLRLAPQAGRSVSVTRDISTHYVSSFDYVGLQAADIAANSAFKYLSHFLKTGDWKRPSIMDGFKMVGGFRWGPVQFDVQVYRRPSQFDEWLLGIPWKPSDPSSASSKDQSS
jgi:hypothetical protein